MNAVTKPTVKPLIRPKVTSLKTYFQSSLILISPSAKLRIVIESVCDPALPPNPATIGIAAAKATTCAMTSSNNETVNEA